MHLKRRCLPLWAVYFAVIFPELVFANSGVLYSPVKVSRSRLDGGTLGKLIKSAPASGYDLSSFCAHFCSTTEWCNVWCNDPEPVMACRLYGAYVLPKYQETRLDDALTCHIVPRVDYATGSTIEGAGALMQPRVKDNIVDGIFSQEWDDCYFSANLQNPYFRLDMGSVNPVRRILLILVADSSAAIISNVEVRLGTEALQEADFGNYDFFGLFPGPGYAKQRIVLNRSSPIMARYVLVRRSDSSVCFSKPSWDCQLQICHIEIS